VSGVRREAVAFASAHAVLDPPIADLRLALSEALANSVMHAFEPDEPGRVTVSVEVDPDVGEVRVSVADDGRGMAPRLDSPGLGVGMALMATLAHHVDVSAPAVGTGTLVALTFLLGEPTVLD
jgi:serine/threonine-protein kinase RsbW